MRSTKFYVVEHGDLVEITPTEESLLSFGSLLGKGYEALKVEVYPLDIKVGPVTGLKRYGIKKPIVVDFPIEKEKRPYQRSIVRFNKAGSPYDEERTPKLEARNRAYLSKTLRKRRGKGKGASS